MGKRSYRPFLVLSIISQVFAVPCNLLAGFVTGLVAPVAALAAAVAGVHFLTGKVPFLGHLQVDEEGERHLSFKLVEPDQVGDLFAEHKEQIGDELGKMKAEIQAIIGEARAQRAGQEESQESSAEA